MKTISVTIVGRSEFLIPFVESLKKVNNKEDYVFYASVEPTTDYIHDILDSIDFIDKKIIYNKEKLGVYNNPYHLLKRVFDEGSEYNIYLEEDLIFSQDITDLSDWMVNNFNDHNYSHYSTYNHCLRSMWKYNNYDCVRERQSVFSPLGFTLTKYQWKTHFCPNWYINSSGWDFSILQYIKSNELKHIEPYISRTKHIGHYGTNCTFSSKEEHDMIYNINYYDGPKPIQYTFTDVPMCQLQ